MSYQDFITQYLGTSYCESPGLGAQCVALAKLYIQQVDGLTLGSFGGSAINGWNTGSPFDSHWEKILNSPTAVPKLGDVVFFAPYTGDAAGHVCIATDQCTSNALVVIEQNAGNGNGDGKLSDGNAIRLHTYDYIHPQCLGWFTYIG